MSDVVIKVENLGKLYRIGAQQERYKTLRESLAGAVIGPLRRLRTQHAALSKQQSNFIWALKDVSFEVKQGEVVGIIGRNGAGKSTLLKILSHITEPTEGRVALRGRVGSLLEVGTGFHPELTGRENIYLNGAILGMKKAELERKFDEIAAFAEIERFLDTPVKRYSSGMYVRLAFAVAAHLEPEILLVDEVLAVGDAAFQKKCLGKMGDVAKEGRTVLFVSHNLQAVVTLCNRAILLTSGCVDFDSDTLSTIRRYTMFEAKRGVVNWLNPVTAPGDDTLKLRSIQLINSKEEQSSQFRSDEPICVRMEFDLLKNDSALVIGFDLITADGITIMRCYQNDSQEDKWPQLVVGRNCIECFLPAGLLNEGTYAISIRISLHCIRWIVYMDSVLSFGVSLAHGVSPFWSALDSAKSRPGVIAPIIPWRLAK